MPDNDNYCLTCYGSREVEVGSYDENGQPVTKRVPCAACGGTGER